MAYYDITVFDGTTIVNTARKQVGMVETAEVVVRMGVLENGAKYDADGTADADVTLGQVIARYQVVGASTGMTSLNADVSGLMALRGRHGTLTGVERAASPVTVTCTARCVEVSPEEYNVDNGPPATADFRQRIFATVVWEKLTEWA